MQGQESTDTEHSGLHDDLAVVGERPVQRINVPLGTVSVTPAETVKSVEWVFTSAKVALAEMGDRACRTVAVGRVLSAGAPGGRRTR